MKKFSWLLLVGCFTAWLVLPAIAAADGPDPSGVNTGKVADVPAAKAGLPTPAELADAVGHNRVSINMMWTLITGFLVMFMQAGFAMVETGMTRAKNASHTMAMNFMIYPLGMLGYYVCGFALMFGGLGAIGTMGGYGGLDHEITLHLFGKDFAKHNMNTFVRGKFIKGLFGHSFKKYEE